MSLVTPSTVLKQVSEAVPEDCRHNIVVVGSLAAGYHFYGEDTQRAVRTKDVDCMLEPFHAAVGAGRSITATAGAGGTISPAGTSNFLERASALDTITPDAAPFGGHDDWDVKWIPNGTAPR